MLGMMTGAIVGGKSVEQAAKLQSSSATVSTHVYAKDPSPVIIMFSPSDSSLMDHSHKDSRHVVIAASCRPSLRSHDPRRLPTPYPSGPTGLA